MKWMHKLILDSKFKNKHIKLFGENVGGMSVLLCRFLTPQEPPKEILDLQANP